MKKNILFLVLIILSNLLTMNLVCCAEDFFIDSNFTEAKNKIQYPKKVDEKIEAIKEKKSLFSKKNKNTKFNYATNKEEVIPDGYYGTLPDIGRDFKYKQQNSTSVQKEVIVEDIEDLNDDNLKPAPFDDALFLDNVVKKKPASNYVNDIQRTKLALMNLKNCIEKNEDIQRFNACVNVIDLYVKNLKEKYENSSESLKESYGDILSTNYSAKVLGNLLYDSNYYARYIPIEGSKYSSQNIAYEKEKLLNRINKTLFLINSES